jgi:hypothetical protein
MKRRPEIFDHPLIK